MWQRVALHFLETAQVDEDEISLLVDICLQESGLGPGTSQDYHFFSEADIPISKESEAKVSIKRLTHNKGVNALLENQALEFEPTGLNVVYGPNGSGKSGYCRVLKKLLRSRGLKTDIHPNAFAENPEPVSVEIEYRSFGEDKTFLWGDEEVDLRSARFFDTDCALSYLSGPSEVEYQPPGLHLLGALAKVSEKLKTLIQTKVKVHSRAVEATLPFSNDSPTGQKVLALSAYTKFEDVEALSKFGKNETDRLASLTKQIAQIDSNLGPERLAALKLTLGTAQDVQAMLTKLAGSFCEAGFERLRDAVSDYKSKAEAAEAVRGAAFAGEPLRGIGEDAWLVLWQAAREYSEKQAFPGRSFPFTEDQAICVLCQQELSESSRSRLQSFDKFVTAEAHVLTTRAKEALKKTRDSIELRVAQLAEKFEKLQELGVMSTPTLDECRVAVDWVTAASEEICFGLDRFEMPELQGSIPVPKILAPAIESLSQEVRELELASREENLRKIRAERLELEQKKLLSENIDSVKAKWQAMCELQKLDLALKQTNSRAITQFASKLSSDIVNRQVTDCFENYIGLLWPRQIPLRMSYAGGVKGRGTKSIQLTDAKQQVAPSQIVSEGEHKCAALSAFLTESKLNSPVSCIVLDDPVSSLDHLVRDNVARVLIEEARARQVLVFTHDITFLFMLEKGAEKASVPSKFLNLTRLGYSPGLVEDSLPTLAQSTKKRIGLLKSQIQQLPSKRSKLSENEYSEQARAVASRIRAAWERAVEEVLLNGSIQRFDKAIKTQSLREVANKICSADYALIEEQMSLLSGWTPAHDDSPELNPPFPEPDELSECINKLSDWVQEYRKRKDRSAS